MDRQLLRGCVISLLALLLMAASADVNADFTIKKIVNCDKGMNVQNVLDGIIFAIPVELRLIGTCDGFEIRKDDVSITALHSHSCPGATVEGEIAINGADGIELSCLDVTGPDGGIWIIGGQAIIEDVHISGERDIGLEMQAHALVEMIGGSITSFGEGASLESSHAVFEDVEISNNGRNAVRAENNSYVEFGGGTVVDNGEYGIEIASSSVLGMEYTTVSNNGRTGIRVRGSSRADIIDAVITDHTRSGLVITDNSSVRWNGGAIAGNNWNGIFMRSSSTLLVLPGEEQGQATEIVDNGRAGIYLAQDSGARLVGAYIPPNGNGFAIRCNGKESSVDYSASPMINSLYVDCIDPDF